jgi:pimeloyl-ACP methyl ester carboxylesterase
LKYFTKLMLGFAVLLLQSFPTFAQSTKIESEDFFVASKAPGIQLFMRHKHLAGVKATSGDKILLFVHGATYPAETAFDLPIEGASMMDLFAAKGYDVYLVDVRGYGRSTRPPEMEQPAQDHAPIVHTADAASDFGSAVDAILKRHNVPKINVMGWSWGTSIVGMYTSLNNAKVNRLVMFAPMWLFAKETALPTGPTAVKLGAYRTVSKDSAKSRWLKGLTPQQAEGLIPPGVFEAWADATWATDPKAASGNLRAPNGVIDDVMNHWQAGKPMYDPSKITVPTFLIHAEWDADLPLYQTLGLFKELTKTPYKRHVELGEGTHTVMLEKNRMQFFREILGFLDERDPLALK